MRRQPISYIMRHWHPPEEDTEKFLTSFGSILAIHGWREMCEFDLIVDGKIVLRDVIYARREDGRVIVRDIAGELREYENCRIEEVDASSTRLVLSTV